MRNLKGTVSNVRYYDTSTMGNNRYTFEIEGVTVFTGVNCMYGYAIRNYEGKEITAQVKVLRNKLTLINIE